MTCLKQKFIVLIDTFNHLLKIKITFLTLDLRIKALHPSFWILFDIEICSKFKNHNFDGEFVNKKVI